MTNLLSHSPWGELCTGGYFGLLALEEKSEDRWSLQQMHFKTLFKRDALQVKHIPAACDSHPNTCTRRFLCKPTHWHGVDSHHLPWICCVSRGRCLSTLQKSGNLIDISQLVEWCDAATVCYQIKNCKNVEQTEQSLQSTPTITWTQNNTGFTVKLITSFILMTKWVNKYRADIYFLSSIGWIKHVCYSTAYCVWYLNVVLAYITLHRELSKDIWIWMEPASLISVSFKMQKNTFWTNVTWHSHFMICYRTKKRGNNRRQKSNIITSYWP